MKIDLEYITDSPAPNTFRVAFHSAIERCLLQYPCVTGLTFLRIGKSSAEWQMRYLVTEPLDDFVLRPNDRISFDLFANINVDSRDHRWVINLPAGEYDVYFTYQIDRDTDWYDFLAKRSRFANITPIWRGAIQSNTILFSVI